MRRTTMLLAAGLLLAGVAVARMQIEVARSPEIDYSVYQSFGFRLMEGVPAKHPLGEHGQVLGEVREAARKTLESRGMTFVESDHPDVWVVFFGLGREDLKIEGTSKKVGPITWVGDPGAHSTRTVVQGTLIVEIVDAGSDERVWSGWATDESASREKLRARAGKATRRILAEFPRE